MRAVTKSHEGRESQHHQMSDKGPEVWRAVYFHHTENEA